ncbi:MAG: hypothetical protein F4Z87_02095 [Gammaproteobacteria bacterium]|nr:hypothetical protein [Gammaproteobacteria bacterium]
MKRSLTIFAILLFSGIALGGFGMYLVYVFVWANETTEIAPSGVNPYSNKDSSNVGFRLNHASLLNLHHNSTSSTPLEDPSLYENSFKLRLAVYSFVAGLSAQELITELHSISSETKEHSRHVREELQKALIERLATVNPKAATAYVVDQFEPISNRSEFVRLQRYLNVAQDTSRPMVQTVFMDWALTDLQSAIDIAKKLAVDFKNNALIGILAALRGETLNTFRQVAKELGDEEQGTNAYIMSFATNRVNDPGTAWHEVIELVKPNDTSHARALLNIAKQWYEHIGFGVLDNVNISNLEKNVKSDLIVQLLEYAVAIEPDQAFQYALTVPSENRDSSAMSRVAKTWAMSDPAAAYQAVSSIEKSGDREYFQHRVVSIWALNEPREVMDNVESFPPNIREYVIDDAIRGIARVSPEEAAELAVKHGTGGPNDFLPSGVIGIWMEIDFEAALNWVYSAPLAEGKRYTWVSAITSNLVESDPRRAFDLAVNQESPDINFLGMEMYETGLEAEVIWSICDQDLELAVELLPKVREGKTKTSAYRAIGQRYIELGDSKKAFNLGLQLTEHSQAEYFDSISWTWGNIDPAGLIESIEDFPTKEIRANVASSLVKGSSRKNFSDAQLEILNQYVDD